MAAATETTRIVVTVEARFVVDVATGSVDIACRAVRANWEVEYARHAKALHGIPAQLQRGHILQVRPFDVIDAEDGR